MAPQFIASPRLGTLYTIFPAALGCRRSSGVVDTREWLKLSCPITLDTARCPVLMLFSASLMGMCS